MSISNSSAAYYTPRYGQAGLLDTGNELISVYSLVPWAACNKMDERLKFVARLLEGEKMVALCREHQISRKTGYKIWLTSFMQYDPGYFDHETCRLEPLENPFGAKVLPMSQV